jgi:hypothetical protein
MPRPILGTRYSEANLSVEPGRVGAKGPTVALSGPRLDQRLRQQRSKLYIEALGKLDAGTYQQNQVALSSLIQAIAAEFPELAIDQHPVGFVSRCYLGSPYVVHICDLAGNIIEHYETYKGMPPLFERARSLALHSGYVAIEVYPDKLRAIGNDGSISVIDK